MIGTVIKIHSDFYYVRQDNQLHECKIREKLKKEKIEIYVGDLVRITDINIDSGQAVIVELIDRENFIPRPAVANISQILIIAALDQPSLDFVQLDRYLAQAKVYNIPAVICINKSDLEDKNNIKDKITSIYEPLGYKIIFTSALTGIGIEELKAVLKSKISVLSGISGVGKSSLVNKISPGLNLKTKKLSAKTFRGTHSTRHTELLIINYDDGEIAQIVDTPGFSYLKFDNMLPNDVDGIFDEISRLSEHCYYSNCLHLHEDGCNVLLNIEKIADFRYQSYKIFVKEALEYKEKLVYSGHKIEKKSKILDTQDNEKVKILKLGMQSREKSRKNKKQKLNFISILNEAYYNNDENSD